MGAGSVLLAWTLSNVSRGRLDEVMRVCWRDKQGLLAAAVSSATSPSASQSASNAVGGYMSFILFSVAGLAGEFPLSFGGAGTDVGQPSGSLGRRHTWLFGCSLESRLWCTCKRYLE